jgi:hypothetical protein
MDGAIVGMPHHFKEASNIAHRRARLFAWMASGFVWPA